MKGRRREETIMAFFPA